MHASPLALSLSLLLFLSLLPAITPQNCPYPQHALYLSYASLASLETLPSVFKQLSQQLLPLNASRLQYSVVNFTARLRQAGQQEQWTQAGVRVSLGKLWIEYGMVYQVGLERGQATGEMQVGGGGFVKQLTLVNNSLQFNPTSITPLTVPNLPLSSTTPKLPLAQLQSLQSLLDSDIAPILVASLNTLYPPLLRHHLSAQNLASSTPIDYNYHNLTYTINNTIKNYTLFPSMPNGLVVYQYYQLFGHEKNCTGDDIHFTDMSLGGYQQVYALSVWRQILNQGIEYGQLDGKVDRKWQVGVFQFCMGDLEEVVPWVSQQKPEAQFSFMCELMRGSPVSFGPFEHDTLFVEFQARCNLIYGGVFRLQLIVNPYFIVRVVPQQQSLTFVIEQASLKSLKSKPLDPNYQVKNEKLLEFYTREVIKGLVGQKVLGTGLPIKKRKFPAVYIPNWEYVVIFDASEMK